MVAVDSTRSIKCPNCKAGIDHIELIDTIDEEPEFDIWIAVCTRCGEQFEEIVEHQSSNEAQS